MQNGKMMNAFSLLLSLLFIASVSAAEEAQGDLRYPVSGNTAFAVDLYSKLKGKEGNLFFSPYSISSALAMTYAGTRGDTATEMAEALRFSSDEVNTNTRRGFAQLNKTFEKIEGMGRAFGSEADFSGMDGTKTFFIGSVLHKAFIEVNEEGTEAAAATAVTMARGAFQQSLTFRADYPFLFVIRENSTGIILFIGRLADPR
jgi:serine protease inhibitor